MHKRLALAKQDKQNAVELATTKVTLELEKASADKDTKIKELKIRLDSDEDAQELAVMEVISALKKERDTLVDELKQATHDKHTASQLAETSIKDKYEAQIKDRESGT